MRTLFKSKTLGESIPIIVSDWTKTQSKAFKVKSVVVYNWG